MEYTEILESLKSALATRYDEKKIYQKKLQIFWVLGPLQSDASWQARMLLP